MKATFKSLALATAISSPLLLANCTKSAEAGASNKSDHHETTEQKGVCPMHAEVTGNVGDTCPKCGMKLEPVNEEKAANTNVYIMNFKTSSDVRAGEGSILSLTPSIQGRTERVSLDIQHDKKIHLIIVSKDLSYFDHVHPEHQSDGTYRINVLPQGRTYTTGKFHNETQFARGGEYVLFADYLPTGANHQVERIDLNVSGDSLPPKKYSAQQLVSNVDGYEVSLVTEGGKFFNEGTSHMAAIVKRNGVEIPADQFENFLAAKAHVVMISEDTKNYLHVHPEVVNGRLSLHTTFGATGIFRGWLQFQTEGTVHTADFVIDVAKGGSPQHAEHKHSH